MRCRFGHVRIKISNQQKPRSPPCGREKPEKGFKDFHLKVRIRVWSSLSYMCRICSAAEGARELGAHLLIRSPVGDQYVSFQAPNSKPEPSTLTQPSEMKPEESKLSTRNHDEYKHSSGLDLVRGSRTC